MNKNYVIAALVVCFVIVVALFMFLVSLKDDKINEQANQLYNMSVNKNIDNALLFTYQDAICNYEAYYVYHTNEFWQGKIDQIELRKSKDEGNETILAWTVLCSNESGKPKIAVVYRYPPLYNDTNQTLPNLNLTTLQKFNATNQ